MTKRAAFYVRVSTDRQTVANQIERLEAVAKVNDWQVVHRFQDQGLSGSKGREERPGLDAALKAGERHSYDVLMVWSLDRLGRSTIDLLRTSETLRKAGRALYFDRERIDTTTDAGEMFYTIMAALGQFERKQIVARVNAGLDRARKAGVVLGRPEVPAARVDKARKVLKAGKSIRAAAEASGLSVGTVHAISTE
jgi:DNA invertase Pin-like site-specific DNA recombinase